MRFPLLAVPAAVMAGPAFASAPASGVREIDRVRAVIRSKSCFKASLRLRFS